MVPKQAYPPTHHHAHLTKTLSPAEAQSQLSAFLLKAQETPHLHPDSLLSTNGVTFSATSGPRGGLAIHHLQRIEAGLRGENLVAETKAELEAQFGADEDGTRLEAADDRVLDSLIESTERKLKMERKRKRRTEEIEEWAAESSSQAGTGAAAPQQQELESFANTPTHQQDWQEQWEYEQSQRPMVGFIGEGGGASAAAQDGIVPTIIEHDEDGRAQQQPRGEGTDKLARRAAKKARRLAEKREKIARAEMGAREMG